MTKLMLLIYTQLMYFLACFHQWKGKVLRGHSRAVFKAWNLWNNMSDHMKYENNGMDAFGLYPRIFSSNLFCFEFPSQKQCSGHIPFQMAASPLLSTFTLAQIWAPGLNMVLLQSITEYRHSHTLYFIIPKQLKWCQPMALIEAFGCKSLPGVALNRFRSKHCLAPLHLFWENTIVGTWLYFASNGCVICSLD